MTNLILKQIGISRERVIQMTENTCPLDKYVRLTLTRGDWIAIQEVANKSGRSLKDTLGEIIKEAIKK